FNMEGEVIGVNTAILSPNGGSIGIGFSMSAAVVTRVVDQLREFGETRRGWLGVSIQNLTPDVSEALGLENEDGALVTDVPEGPAKEGGILSGDVILSFDGQDVENTRELVRMVGETEVGKTVRVLVFREDGTQTLRVTLGRRESAEASLSDSGDTGEAQPSDLEVLGMTLAPLDEEARGTFGIDDGERGVVISSVDEESEAFSKGIRAGDLITEIGQSAVSTPQDVADGFEAAADAGRKSVLLLIRKDGQPRFVALSPTG
ncbi:MAG: PDZ domain-containing protein, partial [Pseudomonadota bacterium]